MNSRIMRDAIVRQSIAAYLGTFRADASGGGFTRGTQWLMWRFESDSTLADALQVSPAVHISQFKGALMLCLPVAMESKNADRSQFWLLPPVCK